MRFTHTNKHAHMHMDKSVHNLFSIYHCSSSRPTTIERGREREREREREMGGGGGVGGGRERERERATIMRGW